MFGIFIEDNKNLIVTVASKTKKWNSAFDCNNNIIFISETWLYEKEINQKKSDK